MVVATEECGGSAAGVPGSGANAATGNAKGLHKVCGSLLGGEGSIPGEYMVHSFFFQTALISNPSFETKPDFVRSIVPDASSPPLSTAQDVLAALGGIGCDLEPWSLRHA